jgi:hypothetical protein
MDVWLADQLNMGATELLGVFSSSERAKKVCQDVANEYFGEANTPALSWLGDDGYASASHHSPATGMWLFQVTRFTVDEMMS